MAHHDRQSGPTRMSIRNDQHPLDETICGMNLLPGSPGLVWIPTLGAGASVGAEKNPGAGVALREAMICSKPPRPANRSADSTTRSGAVLTLIRGGLLCVAINSPSAVLSLIGSAMEGKTARLGRSG